MSSQNSEMSVSLQLPHLDGKHTRALRLSAEFVVPARGVTAIFGPSGCGKTTLLRCMAGLERHTQGIMSVSGETWQNQHVFVPAHKRPIGYVFQEAGLFPHLSVNGNLQYAVKRATPKPSVTEVDDIVALLDIAQCLHQKPAQLSGGEQQRVAIARALLIKPKVLFMDEPLASLDHTRKQELLPYLEQLKQHYELPIFYVSHSADEIARLADSVVVLDQGRTVIAGPLCETLSQINTPIALGEDIGVVVDGVITDKDTQWSLCRITLGDASLWVKDAGLALETAIRLRILAKDVSITLSEQKDSSILNRIPMTITDVQDDSDAATALIRLSTRNTSLIARITKKSLFDLKIDKGANVWAQIKAAAIVR